MTNIDSIEMMIAELVEADLLLPEPDRTILFQDLLMEMYESMDEEDLYNHWNHVFASDRS